MNRRDPGFDVWMVVADMLVGFLCIVFLLRAVHTPPIITLTPIQAANDALRAELEEARRRPHELTETITAIQAANDALRAELEEARRVLNDQPPIITLAETEARFRFPLGSADLSPTFRASLSKDVVPQILHARQKYGINTVQVIGHTDEVPLSNLASTLDKGLIAFIWANAVVAPGSNTDLAMLRAVAVLKVLQGHPDLTDLKLVPYSAGQACSPQTMCYHWGKIRGKTLTGAVWSSV